MKLHVRRRRGGRSEGEEREGEGRGKRGRGGRRERERGEERGRTILQICRTWWSDGRERHSLILVWSSSSPYSIW